VSKRAKAASLAGALLIVGSSVSGVLASSHREAPLIGGDPRADNTDLYAFVSPNDPTKLVIVANYDPLQQPAAGPNFNPFADDVKYAIHIDNDGNGLDDVRYEFRFQTHQKSGRPGVASFLYNGGPITSITDADLLARQTYTVTRFEGSSRKVLGQTLPTVPANIGPRSTPDYEAIAEDGVHLVRNTTKVFAGPRDDPFFVDLGSIFDLGGLRPFNAAHLLPLPTEDGVDGVAGYNTSSIVLQVPLSQVRRNADSPVVGIWASASRRAQVSIDSKGVRHGSGPWMQISRLGNPLINEVVIPRHLKDYWNSQHPSKDSQFKKYYEKPELAALENLLYGGALEDIDTTGRTDLSLILLQGVPGVNQIKTNPVFADMLRINTAIAPCTADAATDDAGTCQRLGVLAGDVAGFPNGRRLGDDVTDIELRAIAQGYGSFLATNFGLPNKSPNNVVGDGLDSNADADFLTAFPFVGLPHQGYEAVPPLNNPI
jgi:Domain of unknown function (DUF4331)